MALCYDSQHCSRERRLKERQRHRASQRDADRRRKRGKERRKGREVEKETIRRSRRNRDGEAGI